LNPLRTPAQATLGFPSSSFFLLHAHTLSLLGREEGRGWARPVDGLPRPAYRDPPSMRTGRSRWRLPLPRNQQRRRTCLPGSATLGPECHAFLAGRSTRHDSAPPQGIGTSPGQMPTKSALERHSAATCCCLRSFPDYGCLPESPHLPRKDVVENDVPRGPLLPAKTVPRTAPRLCSILACVPHCGGLRDGYDDSGFILRRYGPHSV
jgi:hypothetical protein